VPGGNEFVSEMGSGEALAKRDFPLICERALPRARPRVPREGSPSHITKL
jgi:hypothetical protein